MTLILILAGILLLGIPLVLQPLLIRLSNAKAAQLSFVAQFFELSTQLVRADEVPDNLVSVLEILARCVDQPRIIRLLLKSWLRGGFAMTPKDKAQQEFNASVMRLPDGLREKFVKALACGLLGATFSAPVSGAILRRLLFSAVGLPQDAHDAPRFAYQATLATC